MNVYLAVLLILLALLFAASGVAAVTRSWVPPVSRKPIKRIRLYGLGQLLCALSLCCLAVFGHIMSDVGIRQVGLLVGCAFMLLGISVLAASYRGDVHRGSGSPH